MRKNQIEMGKKVNVYCLNYGLAKKNNIIWGRAQGTIYRKYFETVINSV